MSRLSQPQLQHQVQMLVTNGQLSEVQTALAPIGYNLASLAAGETLLQSWLTSRARVKTLLAEQKRATQAEHQARQAAQAEVQRFCQTVRILFGRDEPLLTALGLWSRPNPGEATASGEPVNGKAKPRPRRPRRAAETMAQWRLLVTNAQTINGGQEVHLAGHGWNATRLTAAAALVESYVAAEMNQQQQAQAYQAEVSAAQAAETALRQWYYQAARLAKLALQQSGSPAQQGQLKELLGL